MENKELVNAIFESVRSELTDFVSEQSSITSSLEYEERVLALSRQFAQQVISQSMGKMPKSRNSKKKC